MELNLSEIKKIMILGGSCSGKSTLADKISTFTNYPAYHLDALFLNANWERKDFNELLEIHKNILLNDNGIIDGNYIEVLPERIKWADLIIFIDVPTIIHIYRMFHRILTVRLGINKRYGNPEGTKSEFSFSFLYWVLIWNRTQKKKIIPMLELVKGKKIVVISNLNKLDLKKYLS